VADLTRGPQLQPVTALPRTETMLVLEETRQLLNAERPWTAWTAIRGHLDDPDAVPPTMVLLGARTAAGWYGWSEVRGLLRGRRWLDSAEGGEGWFLLARAEEESGRTEQAKAAYERFVAVGSGRMRGVAHARLGRLLEAAGDHGAAASAFAAASEDIPSLSDWFHALEVDVLVAGDDRRLDGLDPPARGGSPAVRARSVRATARAWLATGETEEALDLLERETDALRRMGAPAEAAPLMLERARILVAEGDRAQARALVRDVAREERAPAASRIEAADLIAEWADTPTAAESLARADAYEAGGRGRDAANALRDALRAGARDDGSLQLRMGLLLFEARDHARARNALQAAEQRLSDREESARAALFAARAQFRGGDRSGGLAALRSVGERYPRSRAAGSAYFLLGDLEDNLARAIGFYRSAAEIPESPDAQEAHYRLGDRLLAQGNTDQAIRAWEQMLQRHPRGEMSARVAFRLGLLHEGAGRERQARRMYDSARRIEPISYYAMRSGEKIDRTPYDAFSEQPRRWEGNAADPIEARAALDRMAILDAAGLEEAYEEELQSAMRRFAERPGARIVLAEGLIEQRRVPDAIQKGRALLREFDGEYDVRLLRVIFPLPWREALIREAERANLDPMLMAGLIRQESFWQPRVASWVGAAGLSQIMPATGAWLAPQVGIQNYRREMLENPEISLRMGTFYLASLIRRYDGHEDLALAGYNAGPARADRWRGQLGHGRDQDMFRERIPFDETNHYVKVVLRNRAVYSFLYE